jgi:hypothetical protein
MRAEHEAAVARGLIPEDGPKRVRDSYARPATPRANPPAGHARQKVVWAVCDVGGRSVATFPFAEKAKAEEHAAALKARGKGAHFLRAEKVPMEG